MFDCPEQIHTSPTSTSSNRRTFLPDTVNVRPWRWQSSGPTSLPFAVGGGVRRHGLTGESRSDLFAVLRRAPHRAFIPCCKTMWLPKIAGILTSANTAVVQPVANRIAKQIRLDILVRGSMCRPRLHVFRSHRASFGCVLL